jgi:signal transduction histidine kinase
LLAHGRGVPTTNDVDTESPSATAAPLTTANGRRRWPLVYIALAAFDVCAILASLYLNHSLVRMHADSLEAIQRWTSRLDRYGELERLAAAVGAPAKDVFDSQESRMETVKLRSARRAFDAALASLRVETAQAPDAKELARVTPALDAVVAAMNTMSAEANMTLTYFGIDDFKQAGEHMASADRAMANVQAAFSALAHTASEIHGKLLARHHELAAAAARMHGAIAVFVVMMIAGATLYGRKLINEAARTAAERQRHYEEMARAKDAAESATRAKSAFLANMSHEIRTPMNVIIGMTDIALDEKLTAEARDCLRTIRRATLGLLGIVNDVLDCSKIESGKVTLETEDVSLRPLVEDVVVLLAARARAKDVALVATIDPALPEPLSGDPTRLKQVLTNLVDNAIKFTDHGTVEVAVTMVEHGRDDVRLRVAVRDTGIGVPADRIGAIFESFTQGDETTTRTHGGTGLGLTISRQLVELMGGQLQVESEVAVGSTFWFELTMPMSAGWSRPFAVGTSA